MDAHVQGKFKLQAHPSSGIVMDIAAFKVSHSDVNDIETTALRAARARSSSIRAMDESSAWESSRRRHTHSAVLSWILQSLK
jgi:hypothetical protein